MSQSSAEAMQEVMSLALERSKLKADQVDYVNAHATGTLHGDPEEAQSVRGIFGDRVPVSSLKGHFGHSLAACGALEVIASVKMIESRVLIPTRNLTEVDESCAGIWHLKQLTPSKPEFILSNNFAFGGMNTSLLIGKV
jgi:3-oxoacyl-[acyl-carrier-protein] synthase II